jgi:hypothetical protein
MAKIGKSAISVVNTDVGHGNGGKPEGGLGQHLCCANSA